jgi:enterochelin esterase-like enzyme
MPAYRPPGEILVRTGIPHGTIDTLSFTSRILGRTHPVFVYRPPGYSRSRSRYPVLYVTDGGEYLSLALMNTILDNLLADDQIVPVVAVFIDPRTDVGDSRTSMRMSDYTMSDAFVNALIRELRPRLMRRYRLRTDSHQTGIMGSSLGALIATYAAFTHPEIFGICAAQSPAYWWKNGRMITMIRQSTRRDFRLYIGTGTIRDAREYAGRMRDVVRAKGYRCHYEEHPEGHNWANWRARIRSILTLFWGTQ